MKTLIVYYSYTRNNELLAYELQKRLGCDILKIEESKKRTGLTIALDLLFNRTPRLKEHSLSLNVYSNFIFIAPVWASKIASPLRSFLLTENKYIQTYSFISLCGGVKGQVEKLETELERILGVKPKRIKELWINDLLSDEKKDTIKYTSGYRITPEDVKKFNLKIDEFLNGELVSDIHYKQ